MHSEPFAHFCTQLAEPSSAEGTTECAALAAAASFSTCGCTGIMKALRSRRSGSSRPFEERVSPVPALVCWRTGPRRCQWHGCLSALLRSLRRVYGGRARHRSARPARRQDSAEKRVPPSPLPIPSYRDEPAPNPSHHHDDPRGGGRATGLTFGHGPGSCPLA